MSNSDRPLDVVDRTGRVPDKFVFPPPANLALIEGTTVCWRCGAREPVARPGFQQSSKRARFCSDWCRFTYAEEHLAELGIAACAWCLMIAGVGHAPSCLAVVAAGTDWCCGLCGMRVDISLRAPDPRAPSWDHIVPESLGGTWTPGNLRLAHIACNARRGQMSDVAWAALTGFTPLVPLIA